MSRVLIMAGGTGGHVFPALAVAKALTARGHTVSWLGTRRGIEARIVPEADIAIDYLKVEGVRGRGIVGLLKAPFLILLALVQALRILRRERPDAVLGFGGFASGPGGLAAWLQRIPLMIHEQNAVAGTTNRILARLARRVATGFNDVIAGAEWAGNPVRDDIASIAPPAERFSQREDRAINMLVLGGSLGARAINELLPQALALVPADKAFNVWHQCGERHTEAALAAYLQAQVQAKVEPFINDMAAAYAWADVVVCRAGALTVAELMAVGLGAVLIPLPSAIDDHQTHNAAVLTRAGAGLSFVQAALSAQQLAQLLAQTLSARAQLLPMAQKARELHRPNAASRLAQMTEELIHG